MTTWRKEAVSDPMRLGPLPVLLLIVRGVALVLTVLTGLAILLLMRMVERPLAGMDRPVSPNVTRGVCRLSLAILGVGYGVRGVPMRGRGAVVANHSSWLDIFALNACQDVYFVSKAEVAGWPLIGWLARATGTVFIARDPREAKMQRALFESRLRSGHRLLFFPEGTSTDGLRVLTFKSTLFAAFFSDGLTKGMRIQPVCVTYRAPPGRKEEFYGWWGDMSFGAHLMKVLAQPRQGRIDILFLPPIDVAEASGRKDIARRSELAVRSALRETLGPAYREGG